MRPLSAQSQVPQPALRGAPSPAPASKLASRLVSVDCLRGVAIFGVIVCHIPVSDVPFNLSPKFLAFFPLQFGALGVNLFIVLSGFCIHLGASRGEKPLVWSAFWKRRFFRLYPPYLAAIALSLLLAPQVTAAPLFGWNIAAHLLMVHNLFRDYIPNLGNPVFWSLGLEEQLYVFYFALLAIQRRWRFSAVLKISAAIGLAWWLGYFTSFGRPTWDQQSWGTAPFALGHWALWPFGFWFSWSLGAYAAEACHGRVSLPPWANRFASFACLFPLGVLLNEKIWLRIWDGNHVAALGLPAVVLQPTRALAALSEFTLGIAFFCLLNWAILVERKGNAKANALAGHLVRAGAGLGLISYSIYLTHNPILVVLEKGLALDFSLSSIALRFLLYIPLSVICGKLFFHAVERHFLSPGQKTG